MIEGEAVKAKAGRNGGKNKVFADGQQGLPPPVPRGYAGSPAYSFVTSDVIEPSATNPARCCYDGQKPGPLENKILSCVCPGSHPSWPTSRPAMRRWRRSARWRCCCPSCGRSAERRTRAPSETGCSEWER